MGVGRLCVIGWRAERRESIVRSLDAFLMEFEVGRLF